MIPAETKKNLPVVRVLMIEDDAEDVTLVQKALGQHPRAVFQVRHAHSLEMAQTIIKEESPEVILLDLNLPDSKGLDTFKQIHQLNPRIPIVVLSGLANEMLAQEAVELGAQDYLMKNEIQSKMISRVLLYALGRRHLEEHLRQLQKMESLGRITSGLAQELIHPFTAILTLIQPMLMQLEEDSTLEMPFKSVVKEAQNGKRLLETLMNFTNTAKAEKEKIDLNQTILSVLSLSVPHTGPVHVKLETEFDPQLREMVANKQQLQQVILSLTKNAMDAMPEAGGVLHVRTLGRKIGGKEFAEIQIQDNGRGIPPEIQDRIFEPFFTTKRLGQGMGLGLPLAYEIVRDHGGKISLQSHSGKGTLVQILLPYS